LLDVSALERLAAAAHGSTGMPVGIVDATGGAVLAHSGWQDLCVMHRAHPVCGARCRESDEYIRGRVSVNGPCENQCGNGLREIGFSIRVAGTHVATLLIGQFFYEGESPDREFFKRQAAAFGFDEPAYLDALDRVPVFSRAHVDCARVHNATLSLVIGDLAEAALRRRQAEEALEREREVLSSVMQATDVMLVYLDPAFDFVWVNAAYAATCNFRPEEMVGKNHFALYPHAENEAIFRRVRDTGEPVFYKDKPFEFPDQPQRGVTYWDWSLVPVKDGSGAVKGLVFSLRETTKYKRAELQLEAERMRWRGVVEGIADEVWVCDAGGRMSLINLPETTAMGLDEFEGKTVQEVLEEVDILYLDGTPRPPEQAPLLRSLRTGEIVRGEEMVRHRASGRLRYRQFSCAPVRDDRGAITGAVAIVRDVTESRRTEEALREANRRKDDFLGMLSHELRNPLAPIRNSIYILRHAEVGGEPATRAQAVIERQTEHLTRLVDDLLDVTRIARGKIELRRCRVDLRSVVARAADDFRLLLHDRGVEYHVAIPDESFWADADATRITQAVGNLLDNAAKFTRRGGTVTLALRRKDGQAEIAVRDTGAGIAPALLPKVFDAFVQGERSLARTEGGLGLGLALVKGIAELHGGTVRVASAGPGKGAEFVVSLPLPSTVDLRKDPALAPSSGGRRVLVVDDDLDAAESLAGVVTLLGHAVEVAHDGPSAIEKARELSPDVVLCDLGLPGMSGLEVARALRATGRAGIQLVAVSGYVQPEEVQRALDAGFDMHVAKPADPAAVERLLSARGRAFER
jgi:PAS domain S-box-containing protein